MCLSIRTSTVLSVFVVMASVLVTHGASAEEELYFSRGGTRGGSPQQYEQGLEMIRENTRGLQKKAVGGKSKSTDASGPTAVSVYFGFDSHELAEATRVELDVLGKELAKEKFSRSGDRWLIEGHTDATGSPRYNQRLSERRAASVVDYLSTRHGVSPRILESVGKGEDELYDKTNPNAGVNRRVRIKYVGK